MWQLSCEIDDRGGGMKGGVSNFREIHDRGGGLPGPRGGCFKMTLVLGLCLGTITLCRVRGTRVSFLIDRLTTQVGPCVRVPAPRSRPGRHLARALARALIPSFRRDR